MSATNENKPSKAGRRRIARRRIVSGMRPTGRLHMGHYHGVLENWLRLQDDNECYFFVADWHALTTNYADTKGLQDNIV